MNPRKSDSRRTTSFSAAAILPALVLALPMLSNCAPGDSNPLIGSWKFQKLTGTTINCWATSVFKENVVVINYPARPADPKNPYSTAVAARVVNVPVIRYMPSPTLVVTLTGGHGYPMEHGNYNFVDKDHMWDETAYGKCYYERTN